MRKKFEIPKHIELLGKEYKINKIPDLLAKSESEIVGRISYEYGVIELQDSTPSHPICEDTMNETYLHEVVHGILTAMESKLSLDEKFVNLFAKHLYQVLKTSDYVK
jgi:hypothetical protein